MCYFSNTINIIIIAITVKWICSMTIYDVYRVAFLMFGICNNLFNHLVMFYDLFFIVFARQYQIPNPTHFFGHQNYVYSEHYNTY